MSRGRSPEHATALAAVWRAYPDLSPSASPADRMARSRERIAAMRPINDTISAQVEADRQARNFAFTEAQAATGEIGERELAILRGRDEHGYDWDRAVAYADGWYAAHAGWNHRIGDNGWANASREAMRHVYSVGFAEGGGDTTDLFDAARRANLAALRADNQPRQAAAIKPARPLPSSWAKPDDEARPTRWSRRLLVVAAVTLAEVQPGEFQAAPASPEMDEALRRSERDGLLIVTLGSDGFVAGYAADAGHPITTDLADAMIADLRHGKALRDLLRDREIDDVLIALQGDQLRVLDAFADALPLCRTMARTRNSALQQRVHLRCWLDRGHAGNGNVGAGHIRWGKAIKGLVGKLGEFTARHAGPAPWRGHLIRVEIAGEHLAHGYVTASGEPVCPEIVVSNKAHLRREMAVALRAFGGATRLA
ncbi:hypothetical protein FOY91_02740 [Sphingomonas solaris]|uniref:Uncharacterized protein n=1 Tax=Alterirhizorhabdus solaris TaxID=2529389 RepID=A0A558RCC6_9SPHN|nr:hypothetical protein FOY91_02740 [Sphingomonas solaris]